MTHTRSQAKAYEALQDGIERGYEGVELIDHIFAYLEIEVIWEEDIQAEEERQAFIKAEIAAGRYTPPAEDLK